VLNFLVPSSVKEDRIFENGNGELSPAFGRVIAAIVRLSLNKAEASHTHAAELHRKMRVATQLARNPACIVQHA